jgi:hypothetical protein
VTFGEENSSDMSSRFTHRYDPVLPVIGGKKSYTRGWRRRVAKRKLNSSLEGQKRHRPCFPAPLATSSIPVSPAAIDAIKLYERLLAAGILTNSKQEKESSLECKIEETAEGLEPRKIVDRTRSLPLPE